MNEVYNATARIAILSNPWKGKECEEQMIENLFKDYISDRDDENYSINENSYEQSLVAYIPDNVYYSDNIDSIEASLKWVISYDIKCSLKGYQNDIPRSKLREAVKKYCKDNTAVYRLNQVYCSDAPFVESFEPINNSGKLFCIKYFIIWKEA